MKNSTYNKKIYYEFEMIGCSWIIRHIHRFYSDPWPRMFFTSLSILLSGSLFLLSISIFPDLQILFLSMIEILLSWLFAVEIPIWAPISAVVAFILYRRNSRNQTKKEIMNSLNDFISERNRISARRDFNYNHYGLTIISPYDYQQVLFKLFKESINNINNVLKSNRKNLPGSIINKLFLLIKEYERKIYIQQEIEDSNKISIISSMTCGTPIRLGNHYHNIYEYMEFFIDVKKELDGWVKLDYPGDIVDFCRPWDPKFHAYYYKDCDSVNECKIRKWASHFGALIGIGPCRHVENCYIKIFDCIEKNLFIQNRPYEIRTAFNGSVYSSPEKFIDIVLNGNGYTNPDIIEYIKKLPNDNMKGIVLGCICKITVNEKNGDTVYKEKKNLRNFIWKYFNRSAIVFNIKTKQSIKNLF